MKKYLSLLFILIFLGGCAGSQVIPSAETVRGMKQIQVLALEPPPLEIPQPSQSAFFFDAPASPETVAKSKAIEALLRGNEIWVPSNVLADEVTGQIAATGRTAVRVPSVQPIPGVTNRDYTYLNENWLRPIREWYNSDKSPFDYALLGADKADAVIEVALVNYSVLGPSLFLGLDKRLWVQVMIKLIDPSTGKIIGRVRAHEFNTYIGDLDKAFAHDGKRFKQVFTQTGRKLIAQCLSDLGLLTAQ